jgi:antitoxin (DNA-binding transcriptional repressor) of toxin-antitoxin stability system
MILTVEIGTGQIAELVKQLADGNEVLLTKNNQPVAMLVYFAEIKKVNNAALHIRSLKGHQVLTPVISQADLVEEMFAPPLAARVSPLA